MKPDWVSGTVALQKPLNQWGFNEYQTSAAVHIGEVETFSLSFRARNTLKGRFGIYELSDLHGHAIQAWHFRFSFTKTTLDLSIAPDFPLKYQRSFFGTNFFLTESSKKPTYMDISESSRSFQLEEMKFRHNDFQSEISFSCPAKRLTQGILIANLLFCPPIFDNGG